ncbi:MAG TPA: Zn-dependent hydrolase, partial [Rhodocyclaceae bacterium]|nr:Zn-dependent hydrolase [Rhodocyclaceae bacterium]
MNLTELKPDRERLLARLDALAQIGRTDAGACCRLALTDDDRAGRDQVVAWMRALGLEVAIDPIGNVFGLRRGRRPELAPVMTGSHIDTVRTGG